MCGPQESYHEGACTSRAMLLLLWPLTGPLEVMKGRPQTLCEVPSGAKNDCPEPVQSSGGGCESGLPYEPQFRMLRVG